MLNPELKNIYSDKVIKALEIIAKYFKDKNEEAYVFGVKGEEVGLKAPVAIFWSNDLLYDEAYDLIHDAVDIYEDGLTSEEDEILGGIAMLSNKEDWEEYREDLITLWL